MFGVPPYSILSNSHLLFQRSRFFETYDVALLVIEVSSSIYECYSFYPKASSSRRIMLLLESTLDPLASLSIVITMIRKREKLFAMMKKLASTDLYMTIWNWTEDRSYCVVYLMAIQISVYVHSTVELFIRGEVLTMTSWIVFLTNSSFVLVYHMLVKTILNKLRFVNSTLANLIPSIGSDADELPNDKNLLLSTLGSLRSMHSDLCAISDDLSESFAIPSLFVWTVCLVDLCTRFLVIFDQVSNDHVMDYKDYLPIVTALLLIGFWTSALFSMGSTVTSTVMEVSAKQSIGNTSSSFIS